MNQIATTLLIAFTALLLNACQSQPQLPSWVETPNHDSQTIYATGQGINLKEAQNNAQQQLASQLLSHVSNQLKSLEITDQAFHRIYTEQLTESRFADIALPNTRFTRQQKVLNDYFVEIALDKTHLKHQLNQSLNQLKQRIQHQLKQAQKQPNAFEQWWQVSQLFPSIEQYTDQLLIYSGLYNAHPTHKASTAASFNKAINRKYFNMKVSIKDRTRIQGLTNEISRQFTQYKVNSSASYRGKLPTIELNNREIRNRLQGDYYHENELTLTLKNSQGSTMATYQLANHAIAINSPKTAQIKSHRKLLNELQSLDLIQAFHAANQ
jgi:hypothetical protein